MRYYNEQGENTQPRLIKNFIIQIRCDSMRISALTKQDLFKGFKLSSDLIDVRYRVYSSRHKTKVSETKYF